MRTIKEGSKVIVEGFVPSRCSIKPRHVTIVIEGVKLEGSHCECGEYLCRHARLLYLEYFRTRAERGVT